MIETFNGWHSLARHISMHQTCLCLYVYLGFLILHNWQGGADKGMRLGIARTQIRYQLDERTKGAHLAHGIFTCQ